MKIILMGLIFFASSVTLANEIMMSAGDIEIGPCNMGLQGAQQTPYAELSISYPDVSILNHTDINNLNNYAHALFIGSKSTGVSLEIGRKTEIVRFYDHENMSAEEICRDTRNRLLFK